VVNALFFVEVLVLSNISHLSGSAEATRHMQRRDLWHGTPRPGNGPGGTKHTPTHVISPTGIYYGQDGIGKDPRALRGGNVPPLFFLGHWLRDQRLTFGANAVELAPAYYDNYAGHFPIVEDAGSYEVIIVGSGLSGLSAAFYLVQARPGIRILMLDSNAHVGGNAARDDAAPIPVLAPAGEKNHSRRLDWIGHSTMSLAHFITISLMSIPLTRCLGRVAGYVMCMVRAPVPCPTLPRLGVICCERVRTLSTGTVVQAARPIQPTPAIPNMTIWHR
jgi:hypothetical protein